MLSEIIIEIFMGFGIGLVGFFAIALFYLSRRLTLKKNRAPHCGYCGYPASGLSSMTCPECGSNFRSVGIITPAMRHVPSLRSTLLLWTLFLPMTGYMVLYNFSTYILPEIRILDQSITLSNPDSAAYDRMVISLHTYGSRKPQQERYTWNIPLDDKGNPNNLILKIYLSKEDHAPAGIIRFNTNTGTSSIETADGELSEYKNDNAATIVLKCFKKIGLNIRNPALIDESSFMKGQVLGNQLGYGLPVPTRPVSASSSQVPFWNISWNKYVNYDGYPKWFFPTICTLWLILWIVGLRYLLMRNKYYNNNARSNNNQEPNVHLPELQPLKPIAHEYHL